MKKYVVNYLEGLCPECQQMKRLEKGTGLVVKHGDGCGFMDGFKPVWIHRVRLTKEQVSERNRQEMRELSRKFSAAFSVKFLK